jgi:hypothetical protein
MICPFYFLKLRFKIRNHYSCCSSKEWFEGWEVAWFTAWSWWLFILFARISRFDFSFRISSRIRSTKVVWSFGINPKNTFFLGLYNNIRTFTSQFCTPEKCTHPARPDVAFPPSPLPNRLVRLCTLLRCTKLWRKGSDVVIQSKEKSVLGVYTEWSDYFCWTYTGRNTKGKVKTGYSSK